MTIRKCSCGSGNFRYALYDARGIFCDYVCEVCEEKVKSKYRPEIFEDGNYECDEPIDDWEETIGPYTDYDY